MSPMETPSKVKLKIPGEGVSSEMPTGTVFSAMLPLSVAVAAMVASAVGTAVGVEVFGSSVTCLEVVEPERISGGVETVVGVEVEAKLEVAEEMEDVFNIS